MKGYFKALLMTLALITALVTLSPPSYPTHAGGSWYVVPDGNDNNDCLSPTTPCATINGAIAKASPGDTIYVSAGTYTGSGGEVVLIDKDVTISGGWNSDFTAQSSASTIDGQGSRRGITVNSGVTAVIERLNVQGGYALSGDGVINGGTLTLNNSTVSGSTAASFIGSGGSGILNDGTVALNNSAVSRNTTADRGGGILNNGTLTLTSCIVSGNSAFCGGGIFGGFTTTMNKSSVRDNTSNQGGGVYANWSKLTVNDSDISANLAFDGGGICSNGATLVLNNSTISGNRAGISGGGIHNHLYGYGNNLTINNGTISGNNAGVYGGGIYNMDSTATLQNTILTGNTADSGMDCNGVIVTSGYNLIGNTSGCTFTPGTGDMINVSARLGQLTGALGMSRYHPLLAGSPAIDAGNPAGCTGSTGPLNTDQRGAARVGRCDIGAYEYTTPSLAASIYAFGGTPQRTPPLGVLWTPFQAAVLDSIGSPVSNAVVTFSAPASGASGTFADTGTYTTTATTNESGLATAATFTANESLGSYTVTATVGGVVTPANFLLSNFVWYVASDGNDSNDCQSPAAACATINGALNKTGFLMGDTIRVAAGTYTGTGDQVVLLNKSVILSGGWNTDFTAQSGASTIDGQRSRLGIAVSSGVIVTIERFIVQNGTCGILNSGFLTLNVVAVDNNGSMYDYGGGIINRGILTLNNSAITRNKNMSAGGGIDNIGTMTVNSSTISSNASGTGGGGIAAGGPSTLNNVTVSGNMAKMSDGGISGNASNLTVQNTILAGNTAPSFPDCSGFISAGHNLVSNTTDCYFTPNTGDITNVNAKLGLLVGTPGYQPLLSGSPAIDAGNPSGCSGSTGALTTDQRGAARVGRCDIGAYEYTTPGPAASIYAFGGTPQRTPPFSAFGTPLQTAVLDSIGSPVSNTAVTFSAPVSGASGTFADTGTYTTTATTNEGGIATAATFTANGLMGSYTVTATVGGVVTPANFLLGNLVWYVAPGGNDSNDCLSPATACATINGALGKPGFVADDTIRVATGTYTGSGTEVVLLNRSATLSGGWSSDFAAQSDASVIDGQGLRRGMTVNSGVSVSIERFIVQNAHANLGGGIYNEGSLTLNDSKIWASVADWTGGGIYNKGTMILNNTIVRETETNANCGGICNEGTLTMNSSTVNANTANHDGGGICNSGFMTINSSAVIENNGGYGWGGGILNGGLLTLNNSTISGNSASLGGGIYACGTQAMNNSTISGNSASWGGGGGISACGPTTLQNTILAGNWASDGPDCSGGDWIHSSGYNLIGNPCFTLGPGDLTNVDARLFPLIGSPGYHPLLPGSPAIDAGNPAGCTDHLGNPLDTDQRGVSRLGRCDIGSYEYDPAYDLLTYTFLPVVASYCPDFFDDFSNPASGWEVGEDEYVRAEYLNGEYRVFTKQSGYVYLFRAPICHRQNYVVEVDARWVGTPGASYGLIFGIAGDFSQFYLFDVNTDYQVYWLLRSDPSGWVTLVDFTYSPAIHSGAASNHLKVTRNGSQITLEVNGTVLGTWQDSTISGLTGVGLTSSPYDDAPVSDARFDNFRVTSLTSGTMQQSLVNTSAEAEGSQVIPQGVPKVVTFNNQ